MTNRILIVDDEPMLSGLLMEILQSKGFTCFCTSSGREAMEFLKTNIVDLIISDLTMPDGDGYFLLDEIRKNNIKIPITICTGVSEKKTLDELISRGAIKCFKKPYSLSKLSVEITELLEIS